MTLRSKSLSEPLLCRFALKLVGELHLVNRATNEGLLQALTIARPELQELSAIAHADCAGVDEFSQWQLSVLNGSSAPPPSQTPSLTWERKYFLEIAGQLQYDPIFWRQAATRAIVGVLTDTEHLRTHLYNFTHAVFYGTDFGKRDSLSLNREVSQALIAIAEVLYNAREWDLYYEIQACRAMLSMLPESWHNEALSCRLLPGQNIEGWIESSSEEEALMRQADYFDCAYSAVHTTLAALLAVSVSSQNDTSKPYKVVDSANV